MISFMSVIGFSFFGCVGIFLFGLLFYKMVNLCVDERFQTTNLRLNRVEKEQDRYMSSQRQHRDEIASQMMMNTQRIKFEQAYQDQLRLNSAKEKELKAKELKDTEIINSIINKKVNEIVKPCAIKK